MENMNHEGMHDNKMMHHGPWHWVCCWLPVVTTIFWLASIASFIILWTSVIKQINVWGYPVEWWIVNSLIFGVLSLFGKGRKGCCCGGHGTGCACGRCAPGAYKVVDGQ